MSHLMRHLLIKCIDINTLLITGKALTAYAIHNRFLASIGLMYGSMAKSSGAYTTSQQYVRLKKRNTVLVLRILFYSN